MRTDMHDPLDWLMDKVVERQFRREQDAVSGNLRVGRVLFLLPFVIVAGFFDGTRTWLGITATLVLTGCAGGFVATGLRARLAYRRGWYNGRDAMIESLREASRRGLNTYEWLRGEMERDINNYYGPAATKGRPKHPSYSRFGKRNKPKLDGSHEDIA